MSFYTDVIQKDQRFRSIEPVRDLNLLEPVTRAAIQCIIADAAKAEHTLVVLESYRSKERQAYLFTKGATRLRNVGVHHYGLACDLGLQDGGKYDPNGQHYLFLRELTEGHGLIWGGDWGTPQAPHSFRDYDHVQRCSIQKQSELFDGVWYPDAAYNPLADYGRTAAAPCQASRPPVAPVARTPSPAKAAPPKRVAARR